MCCSELLGKARCKPTLFLWQLLLLHHSCTNYIYFFVICTDFYFFLYLFIFCKKRFHCSIIFSFSLKKIYLTFTFSFFIFFYLLGWIRLILSFEPLVLSKYLMSYTKEFHPDPQLVWLGHKSHTWPEIFFSFAGAGAEVVNKMAAWDVLGEGPCIACTWHFHAWSTLKDINIGSLTFGNVLSPM